ncbi:hypothetical protein [Neptunomonas antarctica]|nr:hypothetical protein [Neptunomonas antarctica]
MANKPDDIAWTLHLAVLYPRKSILRNSPYQARKKKRSVCFIDLRDDAES